MLGERSARVGLPASRGDEDVDPEVLPEEMLELRPFNEPYPVVEGESTPVALNHDEVTNPTRRTPRSWPTEPRCDDGDDAGRELTGDYPAQDQVAGGGRSPTTPGRVRPAWRSAKSI
jgi:hypothetical protein